MPDLPPPLTPPRSDLRDFGFMPLEIVRFRGSDLLAEGEPEEVLAAIMLWTAAWHETPAASLSDNDKLLAKAAGFGRAVDAWLKVKDGALRGFVKCSDGRLYHPVVARLANEAWKSKVEQRWRTEKARRAKWNERHPDDQLAIPTFEAFAAHYPDDCPSDKAQMSQGQLALVGTTGGENDDDIRSKGESRDRDRDRETPPPPKPPAPDAPRPDDNRDDLLSAVQRITQAGGVSVIRPSALAREMDIVKRWREAEIGEELILSVIAKRVNDMREDETVGSLAYFDAAILKAHNRAKPGRSPVPSAPPFTVKDQDDERIVALRERLKHDCGPRTYDGWLKPTAMFLNGSSLKVVAPSTFMSDWIAGNLLERLRAASAATTGLSEVKVEPYRP